MSSAPAPGDSVLIVSLRYPGLVGWGKQEKDSSTASLSVRSILPQQLPCHLPFSNRLVTVRIPLPPRPLSIG